MAKENPTLPSTHEIMKQTSDTPYRYTRIMQRISNSYSTEFKVADFQKWILQLLFVCVTTTMYKNACC